MKLRNKDTLEIVDAEIRDAVRDNPKGLKVVDNETGQILATYDTLAQLNEEWEDYEEPEVIYYLSWDGVVLHSADKTGWQDAKQIGNYFETKEEAEKAVKKLKAWKRLRDKGFKFEWWRADDEYCGDLTIFATDQTSCDDEDLDLLFGGEE